jgi:ATP-dependent helicase/nuclease subunit A
VNESIGVPGETTTPPAAREALSGAQLAVVRNTHSHVLVQAGAGSGKTRMLVAKILAETGLLPDVLAPGAGRISLGQVVAITFTRKAAGELTERLRGEMLGRARAATGHERELWVQRAFSLGEGTIGTIDSFSGRLIREYGALAGMEASYEVLDEGDALVLHREVAERELLAAIGSGDPGASFLVQHYGYLRARSTLVEFFGSPDRLMRAGARLEENRLKWAALGPDPTATDALLRPYRDHALRFARKAHRALTARMEADGVLDHSHVQLRAAELATHPAVRRAFRERVRLVLVDEHQDTSPAQATLLFRLAGLPDPDARAHEGTVSGPGEGGVRLVMVGDPQQGIYGFRGADIRIWDSSRHLVERSGGETHLLDENYRSRPTLTRFFDACLGPVLGSDSPGADNRYRVAYQPLRAMRGEQQAGEGVELLLAEKQGNEAQAEIVATRIADILANPDDYPVMERGADGIERPRAPTARDIAILARVQRYSAATYARALAARGIQAHVLGGQGLWARREIQDLVYLLRAVADPHEDAALAAHLRSPMGGMDDHTLAELAMAPAPGRRAPGALYRALSRAAEVVTEPGRAAAAEGAYALIEDLRRLRERIPHHELIELALERTHTWAYLAGAPDQPAGVRNMEKLVRLARTSGREPLWQFVERLASRVRRADQEEEAPLYTPEDDLVAISTIHSAKGLEWPFVFVTGIDAGLFREVAGTKPALSEALGLALPLEVVRTDGGPAAPSAIWGLHRDEETLRLYEEGKRLFYVACTRARDRLFLAGRLRYSDRPYRLHEPLSKAHWTGPEHWMRRLFPEVLKVQGSGRIDIAPAPLALTVRRGLPAMRTGGGPVPVAAPREGWPRVGAPAAGASEALRARGEVGLLADPAVRARQVDLYTRAAIRAEFSASELVQFDRCPTKHWFGYQASISTTSVEVASDDARVNRIAPHERGDILHEYLSLHQDAWTPEARRESMRGVIARRLNLAESPADAAVTEMMTHVDTYLSSPLHARMKAAEAAGRPVYREMPFRAKLAPGVVLQGQMDLLFLDEDGWVVVDFKAALFRGIDPARLPAEVASRAASYRLQASAYAMAVERLFPEHPVTAFTFFFTFAGIAETVTAGGGWPACDLPDVVEIVRRIREKEYPEEPAYLESRCASCEFLRVCRPSGTPEELLLEGGGAAGHEADGERLLLAEV